MTPGEVSGPEGMSMLGLLTAGLRMGGGGAWAGGGSFPPEELSSMTKPKSMRSTCNKQGARREVTG